MSREDNLKLTPVSIKIQEAPGKPADWNNVTFYVYHKGESNYLYVAYAYTDTAHLKLPQGTYEVQVNYSNTELHSVGPVGQPIEVVYNQPVESVINLGLGHIRVQVVDAAGQPLDKGALLYQANRTPALQAALRAIRPTCLYVPVSPTTSMYA